MLRWRSIHAAKERIALVPTMGALHRGHLDLVTKALRECDQVVVSIFVNPTQFGRNEDLSKYPRQEAEDLKQLKRLGVDAVFLPSSAEEVYERSSETRILPRPELVKMMEAVFRPGHFDGVVQVVFKLFQIVEPDRAYFGEKDYQQLKVIEAMVEDLFLKVRIRPVRTRREKTGLAMSSRNKYFSPEEKEEAAFLYECLQSAKTPAIARRRLRSKGFKLQYLECWSEDLLEKKKSNGRWYAAALYKGVRLIDNLDRSTKSS